MKEIDNLARSIKKLESHVNILIGVNKQLKQENEDLRKMNHNLSEKFANVCEGCFEQELREKYKLCLDEIEDMCQELPVKLLFKNRLELSQFILQKIKNIRGGE